MVLAADELWQNRATATALNAEFSACAAVIGIATMSEHTVCSSGKWVLKRAIFQP